MMQRLNQKFCLGRSIDRYDAYSGGQATFSGGHKITVLIWLVCSTKGLSTLKVQKVIGKLFLRFTKLVEFVLSYFNFFHNEVIKIRQLFHCTLRKNKLSLPCSVSASNNYVILKACNRNITGKATPVYNEKINPEVTVGLNFCSSEFNHINRTY